MPPRFAYWTILIDNLPTAFRARDPDELLPTLGQLKHRNKDVVLKWFARGRLWESQQQEHEDFQRLRATKNAPRSGTPRPEQRERRGKDWRPGGEHKDPRARFGREKHRRDKREQRDSREARGDRSRSGPARPPKSPARPPKSPARPPKSGDRPWRDKRSGKGHGDRPPRGPRPPRRDGPPNRPPHHEPERRPERTPDRVPEPAPKPEQIVKKPEPPERG